MRSKARARPGLRTCGECRKQFTVKVGTVFEQARMPLHKWLQAVHLMVQQEGHQRPPAAPGRWRSRTRALGSWPTVSAKPCAPASLRRSAGRRRCRGRRDLIGRKKAGQAAARPRPQDEVLTLVDRGGTVRSFHVESAGTSERLADRAREHQPRSRADDRRSRASIVDIGARVRRATRRSTTAPTNTCAARPHEHRRRLLLDLQARHEGRLSALCREASAPLPGRVRFPVHRTASSWVSAMNCVQSVPCKASRGGV